MNNIRTTFILLLISQIAWSQSITDGLTSYYSFEEQQILDKSGNANTGSSFGSNLDVNTGINQNCHLFDSTDYIDLNDSNVGYYSATFNMWIKLADTTSTPKRILHNGGQGGAPTELVSFSILSYSNIIRFNFSNASGNNALLIYSDTISNINDWIMITCTFDTTSLVGKLYINGVFQDSATATNKMLLTTQSTRISYYRTAQQQPHNGLFDELGIWNRTLNGSEIQSLYNNKGLHTRVTETACDAFTSPTGKVWTTSGTYMDTIVNGAVGGADSLLTFDLTINTNNASINQNNEVLEASSADTYQWINCSGNAPLSGETSQSFTPTSNGEYAVITTLNGCVDTSTCVSINTLSINNKDFYSVSLYPNPSNGHIVIELGMRYDKVKTEIFDITGQKLESKIHFDKETIHLDIKRSSGIYWIKLSNEKDNRTYRITKR